MIQTPEALNPIESQLRLKGNVILFKSVLSVIFFSVVCLCVCVFDAYVKLLELINDLSGPSITNKSTNKIHVLSLKLKTH